MKYILCISAIIASLAAFHSLSAQTFIHGYVRDAIDSTAIDSASVNGTCVDTSGSFHTVTNSQGYYCVMDFGFPSGNWRVTASRAGYQSQSRHVWLPSPLRHVNFCLWPNDE